MIDENLVAFSFVESLFFASLASRSKTAFKKSTRKANLFTYETFCYDDLMRQK